MVCDEFRYNRHMSRVNTLVEVLSLPPSAGEINMSYAPGFRTVLKLIVITLLSTFHFSSLVGYLRGRRLLPNECISLSNEDPRQFTNQLTTYHLQI
jgi:hypothetical protein